LKRTGSPDSGVPGVAFSHSFILVAFAAACVVTFHRLVACVMPGRILELGSRTTPTIGYTAVAVFWVVLGGIASLLLASAISKGRLPSARRATDDLPSERRFLTVAVIVAFLLPITLKYAVLLGGPLTDDESAYRFSASLLASGRLWAPSHQWKLFFDQNFVINDGRMYTAYFLGWPALLAPATWLHAEAVWNPLLSALTVPALFKALKYVVGSRWAKAGVLLFISSPFLQVGAATHMSHTACLMALTYALWMCFKTDGATTWHPYCAFSFWLALAFSIRPQAIFGLGLPLLVLVVRRVLLAPAERRHILATAFLLPATLIGVLFLGALWAQNGAPWRTSYTAYFDYVRNNDFRFTTFSPADMGSVVGFDFSSVAGAARRAAGGLSRLNFDLFGWPCSFLFILLSPVPFRGTAAVVWSMAGVFLASKFFQSSWGIDTFGPVHAFELALPVIVLTVWSAARLEAKSQHRTRRPDVASGPGPMALLIASVVVAWFGFVPIRLEAVHRISVHVNKALRAPERTGIGRAVIFAPTPFAPWCPQVPRHFVFFHPINDPDFRNNIIWANDLGPDENVRLARLLSRPAFRMEWDTECEVHLTRIDDPRQQNGFAKP
jgi:hypothetical protein